MFFKEQKLLWLFMGLQLLLWGWFAPSFHKALPLDVVELTTLLNEGVIANYKHPNLPGLILEGAVDLFGSISVVYLLSQLCIVLAYLFIYQLSKDFLPKNYALVSVALTSTVFYYHWPTPEFNHNVLQIPLWALVTLAAWRAVTQHRLYWWFILGLSAGALLWTKYSSGVLLLWVFIWFLASYTARRSLTTMGPWLALVVSVSIAYPQFDYLIASDFLPLKYATARASEGGMLASLNFLLAQLADHLFFTVLLLVGGLIGRGAISRPRLKEEHPPNPQIFMLFVIIAPVIFVSFLSLVLGMGLKAMWGAPMFNFSALVVLYFFGARLTIDRARRIVVMAIVLMPIIAGLYVYHHTNRAELSDKPMRTLWPQEVIASRFHQLFQQQTGHPLKLVAATDWVGGLIASAPTTSTRVMIDGDPVKSPWISETDIKKQGILVAWLAKKGPVTTQVKLLEQFNIPLDKAESALFVWHPTKADKPIEIQYIVLPPSTRS